MKPWLFLLLIGLAAYQFTTRSVDQLPAPSSATAIGIGAQAPDAPVQGPPRRGQPIQRDRFAITPVRSFDIRGRVLGRERYRFDTEAALSPLDLVLGWGPMSDPAITQAVRITQSNRWYHWRVDDSPIPLRQIALHSANIHLIPANKDIERQLRVVRRDDIVRIQGHLVNVRRDDGWQWKSSLTRVDTGAGACELIWVETLQINPK